MPVASMKDLKEREELKDRMTGQPGAGGSGDIPPEAMERPVDGERLPVMFHGIYHEKQIGALCAVHAMNNLVQARLFDEVTLADVARQLDRQEAALLGGEVGGVLAGELSGESANVRGDGFFSVQVIVTALQRAGLACSQLGGASARGPDERGFIFNRREHWFALRRVGRHWFDLNSTERAPTAMSQTHLDLFLTAHHEKGYSVFAVRGAYPDHALERDDAALERAVRACHDANGGVAGGGGGGGKADAGKGSVVAFSGAGNALQPEVDPELAAAAAADPELAAAIAASLSEAKRAAPPKSAAEEQAEMRAKRLARFG